LGALETSRLQTRCGTIEYALSGEGHPAIVLFNGAGVTLEGWRALYPDIGKLAATLAWNRFGLEGSDAPRALQSGARVIAALRELLTYVALEPPYVLVGHSIGGLYVNLFARLHPAEVAAVLMLEATHPRDEQVLHADAGRAARSLSKVLDLPQELFLDNLRSELEAAQHVAREIEAAGPFPSVPLAVITGGIAPPRWLMSEQALQAREAHQRELVHLSPRAERVIAKGSGHFPQLSEPQLVLAALRRLIAQALTSRLCRAGS
jgi:pimeloyl-ACP methyl ester carboxylesterase